MNTFAAFEEESEENPMLPLGVEVAYHLQALHHVDELMHFVSSGMCAVFFERF